MKKNRYVLALGLLIGMAGTLMAQAQLQYQEHNHPVSFNTEVGMTKALGKKAVESGWLSPTQLMEDYGATFAQSGYFPMFQDSSVYFVPSDQATNQTPFSNSWNLYGTVFQPNDELYELQTTGWQFTRFTDYTCDSVRFPYSYIRMVDEIEIDGNMVEVVDTAFVHFYENKNLNATWFFNNSDEIFAIPIRTNFDVATLAPSDVVYVDTVLLTRAAATDTMLGETIPQGVISSAIDAGVSHIGSDNSNVEANVIGVSVAFKTMLPYSLGDTLLSYNDQIVPDKKFNVFGTLSYTNSGSRVIQTEYNNNSFVTNRQVRYGQEFGSLRGYLPTLQSIGWGADFYFPAEFHVTGANVSVNDLSDQLGMMVYPNPVRSGDNMFVSADNVTSKVSIALTDLVGNLVYSINDEVAAESYKISTTNLLPGIYFVTLSADGISATQKVVVTD